MSNTNNTKPGYETNLFAEVQFPKTEKKYEIKQILISQF